MHLIKSDDNIFNIHVILAIDNCVIFTESYHTMEQFRFANVYHS